VCLSAAVPDSLPGPRESRPTPRLLLFVARSKSRPVCLTTADAPTLRPSQPACPKAVADTPEPSRSKTEGPPLPPQFPDLPPHRRLPWQIRSFRSSRSQQRRKIGTPFSGPWRKVRGRQNRKPLPEAHKSTSAAHAEPSRRAHQHRNPLSERVTGHRPAPRGPARLRRRPTTTPHDSSVQGNATDDKKPGSPKKDGTDRLPSAGRAAPTLGATATMRAQRTPQQSTAACVLHDSDTPNTMSSPARRNVSPSDGQCQPPQRQCRPPSAERKRPIAGAAPHQLRLANQPLIKLAGRRKATRSPIPGAVQKENAPPTAREHASNSNSGERRGRSRVPGGDAVIAMRQSRPSTPKAVTAVLASACPGLGSRSVHRHPFPPRPATVAVTAAPFEGKIPGFQARIPAEIVFSPNPGRSSRPSAGVPARAGCSVLRLLQISASDDAVRTAHRNRPSGGGRVHPWVRMRTAAPRPSRATGSGASDHGRRRVVGIPERQPPVDRYAFSLRAGNVLELRPKSPAAISGLRTSRSNTARPQVHGFRR